MACRFNKSKRDGTLLNTQTSYGTPYQNTQHRLKVYTGTRNQYIPGRKKPPKSIENRHQTCFRKVAGIVFWSRILSVFHCSFFKSLWCEITKCCWSMTSANPSRLYWLDLLCWNVCGLQWICAPFFPIMKKTCQIFFSARFIPCSLILFFTEQIKTSGFLVWISPEILLKTRVTLATFQFPELSSLALTAQKI